jgi:hypothetical protein
MILSTSFLAIIDLYAYSAPLTRTTLVGLLILSTILLSIQASESKISALDLDYLAVLCVVLRI